MRKYTTLKSALCVFSAICALGFSIILFTISRDNILISKEYIERRNSYHHDNSQESVELFIKKLREMNPDVPSPITAVEIKLPDKVDSIIPASQALPPVLRPTNSSDLIVPGSGFISSEDSESTRQQPMRDPATSPAATAPPELTEISPAAGQQTQKTDPTDRPQIIASRAAASGGGAVPGDDHFGRSVPGSQTRDNVYFNKPKDLFIYETVEVQLAVQGGAPHREVVSLFQGLKGEPVTREVKVGRFMTAKISAPSELLDIHIVDDSRREYVSGEPIVWRWFVVPKGEGPIDITAELYLHANATDKASRSIRVLRESWTAQARGFNWVKYHVSQFEPVRSTLWTFGAGFAGVLGFFGWQGWKRATPTRKRRKKVKEQIETQNVALKRSGEEAMGGETGL